jgi:hypothetical protein
MPEKPKPHDPPSKDPAIGPTVDMEETGNANFTGNRGKYGKNNILQSDAPGSECCIIQSKVGNVYLEAASQLQSECAKRIEDVKGDKVLFTQSYTMHNTGDVDTYVDGNTTYNANTNFTLNVVGTHTENVKTQNINAQSQTVKVSGNQEISVVSNRTIKVGGKVTEKIGGDEIRDVSGKKELKVGADLLNTFLGGCTWIKGSTDRGITISDKEQINIAGEISLNVGASEKVNVGAHAEQNLGLKSTVDIVGKHEKLLGPAKKQAATKDAEKIALIKEISTSIAKTEAKVASEKARIRSFKFTIALFK